MLYQPRSISLGPLFLPGSREKNTFLFATVPAETRPIKQWSQPHGSTQPKSPLWAPATRHDPWPPPWAAGCGPSTKSSGGGKVTGATAIYSKEGSRKLRSFPIKGGKSWANAPCALKRLWILIRLYMSCQMSAESFAVRSYVTHHASSHAQAHAPLTSPTCQMHTGSNES